MRANLLKPIETEKVQSSVSSGNDGKLDMVIAFDTTGSMRYYIDKVKEHVEKLIPKLLGANPKMRIGVVAFGDYCDMKSSKEFGKAYQVCPLTFNKKTLITFVTNAQNTSGGDGDEFYELVIHKITEETDWRPEAKKSVLLIADSTPHKSNYVYASKGIKGSYDWKEEAKKSAEKGIQWDTLSIRGEEWYEELSKMTNGVHSMFSSSEYTNDLVETAAYARGGAATMDCFNAKMAEYVSVNNTEMINTANAYVKKLSDEEVSSIITSTTSEIK